MVSLLMVNVVFSVFVLHTAYEHYNIDSCMLNRENEPSENAASIALKPPTRMQNIDSGAV